MTLFKNIIRGGQTNIHQLRMMRQILWIGLLISCLCTSFYGVDLILKRIPAWAWREWVDLKKAEFWKTVLSTKQVASKSVQRPYGQKHYDNVLDSVNMTSHTARNRAKDTATGITSRIYSELGIIRDLCWQFFLKVYISVLLLWYVKGYFTRRSKYRRGSRLVSCFKLKWMIKLRLKGSSLKIDGLPLIKGKETSHMLITGTTGSGKTNVLHKLIPQIRHQKAVIIDMNGDFVEKHFDPTRDIILNPFDKRSVNWSPWADCLTQTHYDAFAASLIPTTFKSDPFWDNASRTILSTALEKLKGQGKISELCNLLLVQKTKKIEAFFKGTRASNLVSRDSEKTTASILANLGSHLKSLVYIEDSTTPFSIREWVRGDLNNNMGFLFITASPDQRETLRPLMTAWMDIVLNSLMSLSIDRDRRFWMIIDELPALYKVPSMPMALAESRKYGGCIIAGIQSIAQLEDIYGSNLSASLLDNFNTKVFFRAMNPDTARWISRVLGSVEQEEINENLSYGANTMRDGVNLSNQVKTHQLVTEGEIMSLKDLEAYIKLPDNFPIAKLKMKIEKPRPKNKPFILKDPVLPLEKKRKAPLKKDFYEEDILEAFLPGKTQKRKKRNINKGLKAKRTKDV